MHELGIAEDILKAAEAALAPRPGFRALRVRIRAGRRRGVEPESLRFAFEVLSKGRPGLEGAVLEVEEDPIRFRCRACGGEAPLEDWIPVCPACGSADGEALGGDEIVLESIEAEEEG
ncbi:MAG: hydrogenase maturation nickel metallochaperone HypA [Planctomycetes bacterium]|jgi:hydrogenase nickel incorporation protein HypA/HybF|nr:hydrogenase maturation nickel metallochaperone HypA [Planctomycetota bacterium]